MRTGVMCSHLLLRVMSRAAVFCICSSFVIRLAFTPYNRAFPLSRRDATRAETKVVHASFEMQGHIRPMFLI